MHLSIAPRSRVNGPALRPAPADAPATRASAPNDGVYQGVATPRPVGSRLGCRNLYRLRLEPTGLHPADAVRTTERDGSSSSNRCRVKVPANAVLRRAAGTGRPVPNTAARRRDPDRYGRTGEFWAQQHFDLRPDMLVAGGAASGFPLFGITASSELVAQAGYHSHSPALSDGHRVRQANDYRIQ